MAIKILIIIIGLSLITDSIVNLIKPASPIETFFSIITLVFGIAILFRMEIARKIVLWFMIATVFIKFGALLILMTIPDTGMPNSSGLSRGSIIVMGIVTILLYLAAIVVISLNKVKESFR
jgi:hypothetical protein